MARSTRLSTLVERPTGSIHLVVLAIAWLGIVAPTPGLAQRREAAISARPGTPMRIRAIGPPPATIAGTFAGVDSVGLSVVQPAQPDTTLVRWDQIALVTIRRELTAGAAFRRGARVGVLVSGGISLIVLAAAVSQQYGGDCSDCITSPLVFAIPAVVVLTGSGALIGGILGSGNRYRWEEVRP